MITPGYCVTMARYNAWQTAQLRAPLSNLTADEAEADRGGFFGGIRATLSHLLWGDTIWMARFDGGTLPDVPLGDSAGFVATLPDWQVARDAMDQRILAWAQGLSSADLAAELTWWSGAAGREVSRPLALCVTHFFNHQTHHRGQVHGMLTAAGQRAPVSDLFLMPDP